MMDEQAEEYVELVLGLNALLVGHHPVAAMAALGSALASVWQQARADGCPDYVMRDLLRVITKASFKDTPQ